MSILHYKLYIRGSKGRGGFPYMTVYVRRNKGERKSFRPTTFMYMKCIACKADIVVASILIYMNLPD